MPKMKERIALYRGKISCMGYDQWGDEVVIDCNESPVYEMFAGYVQTGGFTLTDKMTLLFHDLLPKKQYGAAGALLKDIELQKEVLSRLHTFSKHRCLQLLLSVGHYKGTAEDVRVAFVTAILKQGMKTTTTLPVQDVLFALQLFLDCGETALAMCIIRHVSDEDINRLPKPSDNLYSTSWDDVEKRRPLIASVETENACVLKYLLQHKKVRVDLRASKTGQSPLMIAAKKGALSLFQLLLTAGASLEAVDKQGWNAMAHAVAANALPIVKKILNVRRLDTLFHDVKGNTLPMVWLLGQRKRRKEVSENEEADEKQSVQLWGLLTQNWMQGTYLEQLNETGVGVCTLFERQINDGFFPRALQQYIRNGLASMMNTFHWLRFRGCAGKLVCFSRQLRCLFKKQEGKEMLIQHAGMLRIFLHLHLRFPFYLKHCFKMANATRMWKKLVLFCYKYSLHIQGVCTYTATASSGLLHLSEDAWANVSAFQPFFDTRAHVLLDSICRCDDEEYNTKSCTVLWQNE